jgi:gliding motility-associated-like protein
MYYVSPINDSAFVANPFHTYENVGSYLVTLQVTNSFGCVNETERVVVIEDEFAMFIPNSFTPTKNDGKNDEWCVQGRGFLPETFELTIYDRWGGLVFKTNDINNCWDGSIKGGMKGQSGVYVYKIILKDHKKHVKELLGHITLL